MYRQPWGPALISLKSKSTASGRATRKASERSGVYEGVEGDRFSLCDDLLGQEGGPELHRKE
jgi:hypothetical protein